MGSGADQRPTEPAQRRLAAQPFRATMPAMGVFITFLLGIGNFAMHRAVLESGHPMLREVRWHASSRLGRMSMALEFVLLLAAMLLVDAGRTGWGMTYAVYSGLNAIVAWTIVTRRF